MCLLLSEFSCLCFVSYQGQTFALLPTTNSSCPQSCRPNYTFPEIKPFSLKCILRICTYTYLFWLELRKKKVFFLALPSSHFSFRSIDRQAASTLRHWLMTSCAFSISPVKNWPSCAKHPHSAKNVIISMPCSCFGTCIGSSWKQ